MTKFKTTNKTSWALLAILQLGVQVNASDVTVIDLPPLESSIEEIGQVFGIFTIIKEIEAKYNLVFEEKFKDLDSYPEMSLIDLGNEIIAIIDKADELPAEIRENLKKLIDIKKVANSVAEIKAPHKLINEILIQLANFKLNRIQEGMNNKVLLKYFTLQEIAKINQVINTYKKGVKNQMDRGKFKSIDEVKTDLKTLGDKITAVLKDHPLYLAFKTKCASEEKPASLLGQTAEDLKLLKIFNYRIAQNKRQQ